MAGSVVIGLSAVVMAIRDGEAVVLTVRRDGRRASPAACPPARSTPAPAAPSSWRCAPS